MHFEFDPPYFSVIYDDETERQRGQINFALNLLTYHDSVVRPISDNNGQEIGVVGPLADHIIPSMAAKFILGSLNSRQPRIDSVKPSPDYL